MKDNQYGAARLAVAIVYVMTCIASIIAGFFNDSIKLVDAFGILGYAIISCIILFFLGKIKGITKHVYCVVACFMFLFEAVVLCMAFSCRELIIPLVFINMLLNIMFFDKTVWLSQVAFQIGAESVVLYADIAALGEIKTDLKVFAIYIIGTIIATWLGYILISYVTKQIRISEEQQQSLDDLIKVVEAKCMDARAASKVKSSFLANISHELRTPLNAILGMNMLIERDANDYRIREYSTNIDTYSKELLAKINDILEYSVIDAGKMEISSEEYKLLFLLNDINNASLPMAKKKKLKFIIDADSNIPSDLSGDFIHVKQIIMNIISNAIKYTREGEVIFKIGYERVEKADYIDLKIEVTDTGCGIREENIEKIFEPFSEDDDTKYIEGTGIGLVTVKELLKLMGGKVEVTSTLGSGSTFYVTIPQRVMSENVLGAFGKTDDNKNEQKTSKISNLSNLSKDENGAFNGLDILVVDDVAVNLKVFKGLLKKTMANIDTASSGKEALELVKDNKYNIIFLDHMMPEMDGVETFNEIKAIPGFSIEETPVIVLTANAIAGAKEEYLSLGFCDYISKPIKKEDLYKLIEKYTSGDRDSNSEKKVGEALLEEHKPMSIEDFSFLNTEEGLKNCGGDEELYFEVIREYCVAERTNEMESFYSKEDWKNYEILVHALKSTSKSIGADSLSESAKALERAAKEGDVDYIHDNHYSAFEEYKNLLQMLNSRCSGITHKQSMDDTGASKYVVYVVDDDSVNLKVAEGILEKYFEVRTFSNGQSVIAALKEKVANLILLDIKMPEMSGFDVIDIINNNDRWRDIPVIFLTAEDDTDTEIQGFKVGAMDFIRKPFAPQIMLERVHRIIELNQLKNYLESEVNRKTSKVEKLSLQAMQTLAMTIDAKDKYTNGHSTRVAKYSRMLAKRIGYSNEDLETIFYMGLLHDIGKIGVKDTIINKEGGLTDSEFAEIKKHPEIGYGILKNITEIPDIEKGARWHHERYDGRGYPDGLKGVEIPLFARIIAVADSYDAMTSKRSYRDVLPQDYVRGELIKGKGTQFDPAVADVMVKLMDEDIEYNMREQ